jgi:hypothetical protein
LGQLGSFLMGLFLICLYGFRFDFFNDLFGGLLFFRLATRLATCFHILSDIGNSF